MAQWLSFYSTIWNRADC